jgi:hypothetical protein
MRLRSELPDPEIDREEEAWWNEHAATIEAIWAMAAPVRRTIRAPYLGRARQFFLEGTHLRPTRCLEVGCGSGWVGRMIAAPGKLELIGWIQLRNRSGLRRRMRNWTDWLPRQSIVVRTSRTLRRKTRDLCNAS